jgi:hypothetical protein
LQYWGFELRAKCSTTWALPLTLFCFSYFLDKVLCFLLLLALYLDSPTSASCIAGITGTNHYSWLVCWDGTSLFALAGLELWPSFSRVIDTTDICHYIPPLSYQLHLMVIFLGSEWNIFVLYCQLSDMGPSSRILLTFCTKSFLGLLQNWSRYPSTAALGEFHLCKSYIWIQFWFCWGVTYCT